MGVCVSEWMGGWEGGRGGERVCVGDERGE